MDRTLSLTGPEWDEVAAVLEDCDDVHLAAKIIDALPAEDCGQFSIFFTEDEFDRVREAMGECGYYDEERDLMKEMERLPR